MARTFYDTGIAVVMALLLAQACGTDNSKKSQETTVTREDLIRHQQEVTRSENEDIESYIRRRNLDMKSTETGLRYNVVKHGTGTQYVAEGNRVLISYRIGLLDGSTVYSSDSTGNINFVVGKSDFASGMQEGLKYMKKGDEAILIVPSHLAYGLTGDGDRISHYDVLVIDLKLLDILE